MNSICILNLQHALGKEVAIPHIPDETGEVREKDDKAVKRRSTISPVKEDINIGKICIQQRMSTELMEDCYLTFCCVQLIHIGSLLFEMLILGIAMFNKCDFLYILYRRNPV